MDTDLIAEATIGIMEAIQSKFGDDGDFKILAVGIVAVVEGDEMTFTRTYSTEKVHHRALGLFDAAVDTVKDGHLVDD